MMTGPIGTTSKAKTRKTKAKMDLFGPRLIARNSVPGSIVLLFMLDNQEQYNHAIGSPSITVVRSSYVIPNNS